MVQLARLVAVKFEYDLGYCHVATTVQVVQQPQLNLKSGIYTIPQHLLTPFGARRPRKLRTAPAEVVISEVSAACKLFLDCPAFSKMYMMYVWYKYRVHGAADTFCARGCIQQGS
jgi:hypothetical protein